jgi:hypothetical protein
MSVFPPENVERQSNLAKTPICPKYISGVIKTLFKGFYYMSVKNIEK